MDTSLGHRAPGSDIHKSPFIKMPSRILLIVAGLALLGGCAGTSGSLTLKDGKVHLELDAKVPIELNTGL